jgi:hypothetical protein
MAFGAKELSGSERVASIQELVANDVISNATAAQAGIRVAMIKRRRVVAMLVTATTQIQTSENSKCITLMSHSKTVRAAQHNTVLMNS